MSRLKRKVVATLPFGTYEAKITGFDEKVEGKQEITIINMDINGVNREFRAYTDAQWDTQVEHILAQLGLDEGTIEDAKGKTVQVKYHPYQGAGYDTPLRSWSFDPNTFVESETESDELVVTDSEAL